MALSTDVPGDTEQIRQAIAAFLQDRLKPKLDKLKEEDHDARQKLLDAHDPQTWIADAAKRVGQIQQATHVLKYTHPDAKGSNINTTGNDAVGPALVSTHSLAGRIRRDVAVRNAAALDIYTFLQLDVDGITLLDRAVRKDTALSAAFSDNETDAQIWIRAFALFVEPVGRPSTHTLAKQIYWSLDKDTYHLLAPLFPSSLVDAVWNTITEDRFSDIAKEAREAWRTGKPHPHGYREYPNLVQQAFGGNQPQNISQLNTKSQRGGKAYLLPSLPPTWQSDSIRPPFFTESVFANRFSKRFEVKHLTQELSEFLKRVAKVDSNIRIRDKRAELVGYLLDELLRFTAELHELDAGWSQDERCGLNAAEQCWLDPKRAAMDEEFAARWLSGKWQDELCLYFGNWLNAALSTEQTPMGQAESEAWQTVLHDELSMIRLELADHD